MTPQSMDSPPSPCNQGLTDWWRVLQSTLRPDVVDASRHAHRRDVPVPHLAKIADLLDHVVGPFVIYTQRLAHIALQSEQASDIWVGGVGEGIDVRAGDAF